jgi:enoyl-CoA hydratase
MNYNNLLFESQNRIAKITFNRPKALNALNNELLDEMRHLLERIAEDESVRAVVLTGSGEKAFVAGADISELNAMTPSAAKAFAAKGHRVMRLLEDLPVPVIAAVNGFALGGGCEIALACDFIYASETAKFGLPEINLGLIPGFGGTQRLPRIVGRNMAKELIYTGRMIDAREAASIGLVNRVFSPETLLEETLKTAGLIASRGAFSVRAAKTAVNRGLDVDLASGCLFEADSFALCFANEDSKEGTSAFLEKRKPEFKGGLNR